MLEWLPVDIALNAWNYRAEPERLVLYGIGWLWALKWKRKLEARVRALESPMQTPLFIKSPNYTIGRFFQKPTMIICHWINGDIAIADAAFTGKNTEVSAHFAVDGETVHQYVSTDDTAWHCGNWIGNLKSIGIEHAGSPTLPVSDATYETSADLIVSICRKHGLVPSRQLLHKHSDFRPTQCPGTLDLDRLATLAVSKWFGGSVDKPITGTPAIIASAPVTVTVPITFTAIVSAPAGTANFRTAPSTSAPVVRTYPNGTEVDCVQVVEGDTVTVTWRDGRKVTSNQWFKSKRSGYFVSAAVSIRK